MENNNKYVIIRKRYNADACLSEKNTYFVRTPKDWVPIKEKVDMHPEALMFKSADEAKQHVEFYKLAHEDEYVDDNYKCGVSNCLYAMNAENFKKFANNNHRWCGGFLAGLARMIA